MVAQAACGIFGKETGRGFAAPRPAAHGAAMDILMQHLWLVPVVFFTAILTAVSGAGGGVLLLGLMAGVLPPAAVVPVHGAVMMPQNLFRLGLLWKKVDWRFVGVVVFGSVLGAFLAGPLAVSLPENAMRIILGLGLLYLVWAPKMKSKVPDFPGKLVLLAVCISIVTMVIGAAGVLYNAIRRRAGHEKETVLADQSAIMAVQHALKMIVFGLWGFVFAPYIPLVACMAAMGMVGTFVGVCLMKKMSSQVFDHIFKLVVSILAGKLLVDAYFHLI
jgi:uncharacterized protein